MTAVRHRISRQLVEAFHRLSTVCLCAPFVFGAIDDASDTDATPPPGNNATPETASEEPPDDVGASAVWYRPPSRTSRTPADVRYVPLGVLIEPQLAVGSLRGGTLTTVLATIALAPAVGLVIGAQFADAPRLAMGIDLFRYVGVEVPINGGASSARLSAIFAPTLGLQSIYGAGVMAGDFWTAPAGLRAVIQPARSMAELRVAGHFLIGGQVESDNPASVVGTAGTLGLQLVVAPLFIKSRSAETASIAGESR